MTHEMEFYLSRDLFKGNFCDLHLGDQVGSRMQEAGKLWMKLFVYPKDLGPSN